MHWQSTAVLDGSSLSTLPSQATVVTTSIATEFGIGSPWGEVAKLTSDTATRDESFGRYVAMDGERIAVDVPMTLFVD